ncbi:MAG: signal recognition particle receptor subunit alpha, partial [Polyangiaceae bacterium]|nr:signal recognition particle receptor subunit alpha [Polyangiaceae bacterium]
MFEALTNGFRQARNRLAGLTELSASNIEPALREVRLSLLEADVDLKVVKSFLARFRDKTLGQTLRSTVKTDGVTHQVTASDLFIKLCHDELVNMMGNDNEPIAWAQNGPTGIMMVGLQGSG